VGVVALLFESPGASRELFKLCCVDECVTKAADERIGGNLR